MSLKNIRKDSTDCIVINAMSTMFVCTPYKQNFRFDNHEFKDNMLVKNGKIDTSKKMIKLGGGSNKWQSNIKYTTGKSKIKTKMNPQVKSEKDHRKKKCMQETLHNDAKKADTECSTKCMNFSKVDCWEVVDDYDKKIGEYIPKENHKINLNKFKYTVQDFLKPGCTFVQEQVEDEYIFFNDVARIQGDDIILDKTVVESNIQDMIFKQHILEKSIQAWIDKENAHTNIKQKLHCKLTREAIENKLKRLKTRIEQLQESIIRVQGGAMSIKKERVERLMDRTEETMQRVNDGVEQIQPGVQALLDSTNNLVHRVTSTVNDINPDLVNSVDNMAQITTDVNKITKPYSLMSEAMLHFFDYIRNIVGDVCSGVTNIFNGIVGVVKFFIEGRVKNLCDMMQMADSCYFRNLIINFLHNIQQNPMTTGVAMGSIVVIITSFFALLHEWTNFFKDERELTVDEINVDRVMGDNMRIKNNPLLPLVLTVGSLISAITGIVIKNPMKSIKNIFESIKIVGSLNILTCKFEEAIPKIYAMLPAFLLEFAKEKTPRLHEYIIINYVDLQFGATMQRLYTAVQERKMLKYNAHKLNNFLSDYALLKTTYIDKYASSLALQKNMDLTHEIDDIHTDLLREGYLPGNRIVPTVIWLCGESGIGKSTLARKIAMDFMNKDVPYEQQVYTWNTALPFADGYNNQRIVILNDYMQFTNRKEAEILIAMKDGIDFPLNVSSVDNETTGIKGEVRFTSTIVIVTSNMSYLMSSPDIICTEAFNRRRDVVIEMKHKMGATFNEDNQDFSWCTFTQLPPLSNLHTLTEGTSIKNLLDVRKICKRTYLKIFQTSQNRLDVMSDEDVFHDASNSTLVEMIKERTKPKYKWHDLVSDVYKPILSIATLGLTAWQIVKWFYSCVNNVHSLLSGDEKTMNRLPQRIRDRVMASDNSAFSDVIDKIRSNYYRVTTSCIHETKSLIRSLNGLVLYDSVMLLPKHLFYRGSLRMQRDDLMFAYNGHVTIECRFDPQRLTEYDRDFVTYNFNMILPRGKKLEKFFMNNKETLTETGVMVAITLSDDGAEVVRHHCAYNITDYTREFLDDCLKGYEYKYHGYGLMDYNTTLTYGDCGGVIMTLCHGAVKIVGIHIGGSSKRQYGLILKARDIKFDINALDMNDLSIQEGTPKVQGRITYIGDLPVKERPFHATKSTISKSEFYNCLQDALTQPAILSPNDRRNVNKISPIEKSFVKYTGDTQSMSLEVFDEIKIYFKKMYKCLLHGNGRVLNLDEAINGNIDYDGIDMNTSAGYPFTLKGERKTNFFTFDGVKYHPNDKFMQDYEEFTQNVTLKRRHLKLLWTVVAKDERRKHKKIEDVDTRTFTVGNLMFLIYCRQHIGDFVSNYMKTRMKHCGTIGINPYSTDFHELFTVLNEFMSVNAGDFTCMDGTIMNEVYQIFKMLMDEFYGNTSVERDEILLEVMFSFIIVMQGLYQKHRGNNSGWLGTVITNDFGSLIVLIYAWIAVNGFGKSEEFLKHVRMFVYGDDNIFSVSNKYKDVYNAKVVEQYAPDLAMKYTSSDKGGKVLYNQNIFEVTFLKNYFVRQPNGIVMGALDKTVIQEIPSWIRDGSAETMQMILDSTLRMAWFWGPDYFENIRNKLKQHNKRYVYLTYDTIEYDVVMDTNASNKSKNFNKMPETILNKIDAVKSIRKNYKMNENKYIIEINELKIMSEDTTLSMGDLRDTKPNEAQVTNYGVSISNQNNVTKNIRQNILPRGTVPENKTDAIALMSRPQFINRFKWDATQGVGFSLDLGSFPSILFKTYSAQQLRNVFKYFRGTFVVQMTVHSVTFNQGLGIVHAHYSNNDTSGADSINSAFIRQHALIDGSDNSQSCILRIPYRYYKNYLQANQSTDAIEMARLIFTVIVPVITATQVTINGWIEDIEMVIPNVMSDDYEIDLERVMGITLFGDTTTINNNSYGNIAGNLNPSNINGDQLDVKNDLKFSALDAPIKTVDTQVITLKRIGNSSNGEYIKEMERLSLYPSEQNLTYFDTFGTTQDEMSIEYLCGKWNFIPVLVNYTTITTPGTILYNQPVGPMNGAGYQGSFGLDAIIHCDLLDYVSSTHLCWKGDAENGCFEYYVRFVCSRWHSGRIWFGFYPDTGTPTTEADLYSGYGAYLDINGQTSEFIIRVPYLSTTDWKYVFNGSVTPEGFTKYFAGSIAISAVTPLIAPTGSATEIYMVLCRRATKGYKIGVPVSRNIYSWDHYPQSEPTPIPPTISAKAPAISTKTPAERVVNAITTKRSEINTSTKTTISSQLRDKLKNNAQDLPRIGKNNVSNLVEEIDYVQAATIDVEMDENEFKYTKKKINKRARIDICDLIRSIFHIPRMYMDVEMPYTYKDQEYVQSDDAIIDLTVQSKSGNTNEARDIEPTRSLRDLLRKWYLRYNGIKQMTIPDKLYASFPTQWLNESANFLFPVTLDLLASTYASNEDCQRLNPLYTFQYLYAGRKGSRRFRIVSSVYEVTRQDGMTDVLIPRNLPHKVIVVNMQQFQPEWVHPSTESMLNLLKYEQGWMPNDSNSGSANNCVSLKHELSLDGSIITEFEMPNNIITNYEEVDNPTFSPPWMGIGISCCGSGGGYATGSSLMATLALYECLGDDARLGILDNSPSVFGKKQGWNTDGLFVSSNT